MPPPVFCKRVRKRLKAKSLERKTEYTENGRVRKSMSRKGLDRVAGTHTSYGICGLRERSLGSLQSLGTRNLIGCSIVKERMRRVGRKQAFLQMLNRFILRMLTWKYRYVKRYFYVLEGQGDAGSRAAADIQSVQSSPRKARWSMDWNRASRRSRLAACLDFNSRISATLCANSFCSGSGGTRRISSLWAVMGTWLRRACFMMRSSCLW